MVASHPQPKTTRTERIVLRVSKMLAGMVPAGMVSAVLLLAVLLLAGLVSPAAAQPNPAYYPGALVINEIDYIQPGANNAEFIEIKNVTNTSVNLDHFNLRFARGTSTPPDVYRRIDLPAVNLPAGAYFVVCTNPALVPNCTFVVEPAIDLLENATPAAVAIFYQDTLVDAVSYGGSTGAPYTEGSGIVPTEDGTVPGLGLSRVGDGVDTNRNNIDFGLRCVTPGQPNSSQSTHCTGGAATPTFTPTPTMTPTPTRTPFPGPPTPIPRPPTPVPPHGTQGPPPPPNNCRNVLSNGDFESNAAWEFGRSPVPGRYTSAPAPHSGQRSVLLGNPPDSGHPTVTSYSSIRQRVTLPDRAASVQLHWHHLYRTEGGVVDNATDQQPRQEVILLASNGDTLHILERVRRNEGGWQKSALDLSQFAGETFYVYFNVYNTAGGGRTWMILDDVALLVCGPGGPGTPNQPYYPTAQPPYYPTIRPPAYPTPAYPTPYYPTPYPSRYPTAQPPYYPTPYPPYPSYPSYPSYPPQYPPQYPSQYPPQYPPQYPTGQPPQYPPYYPPTYPPSYPTAQPPYYPPASYATPVGGPNCAPNYPTVCIAPPPPALDCRDIPYAAFPVVGADPHQFDGNGNGIGCEDY